MATKKTTLNASMLLRPRITEKAAQVSTKDVYTFDISVGTTKSEIMKAIKSLYKVTPIKINVVTVVPKVVTRRGKPGMKPGGKKAYVYLKKGDKIELL